MLASVLVFVRVVVFWLVLYHNFVTVPLIFFVGLALCVDVIVFVSLPL